MDEHKMSESSNVLQTEYVASKIKMTPSMTGHRSKHTVRMHQCGKWMKWKGRSQKDFFLHWCNVWCVQRSMSDTRLTKSTALWKWRVQLKMHWHKYASNWCVIAVDFPHEKTKELLSDSDLSSTFTENPDKSIENYSAKLNSTTLL